MASADVLTEDDHLVGFADSRCADRPNPCVNRGDDVRDEEGPKPIQDHLHALPLPTTTKDHQGQQTVIVCVGYEPTSGAVMADDEQR
jgi:hypothetical protein